MMAGRGAQGGSRRMDLNVSAARSDRTPRLCQGRALTNPLPRFPLNREGRMARKHNHTDLSCFEPMSKRSSGVRDGYRLVSRALLKSNALYRARANCLDIPEDLWDRLDSPSLSCFSLA
jgi:hypothetical protein